MSDPIFFQAAPTDVGAAAVLLGATLPEAADPRRAIRRFAPLASAGPHDLAFLDRPQFLDEAAATRAGCCLVVEKFADRLPATTIPLVVKDVPRAYARIAAALFPTAMRPQSIFGAAGVAPGAFVHPTARLEQNVTVDPGAVIGPGAEIGGGTIIAANAVIGPEVRIGRDCSIGPGASLVSALLGNRVIIHAGARIGQDGFGYSPGRGGHTKIPQVGRVILQDDVEIGASTTIDRGSNRDTVIGEGSKIDNLVQIAHNVTIGRHCILVGHVGIAGSVTIGDFVIMGGKVGVRDNVTIGDGVRIAASSLVGGDIAAGQEVGGAPAKPIRQWIREMAMVERLARGKTASTTGTT